jgi:heat-inducible transcriptional repressor
MNARVLTPRQQRLVTKVIEEHIRTAEPVSSKMIAMTGYFDVRSATIRNEMSDLEEAGYLQQLHTSGGRVPTALAYRLYVDELVAREGASISHAWKRRLDDALVNAHSDDAESVNRILARTVGQLSGSLVMASAEEREDTYKVGLSNLLSFPEFREMDRLMGLTEFFDQFDAMSGRLHRRMWGRSDARVRVCIGAENPDDRVKDETLIVSRYELPDGSEGSLTLVGPMRMDYRKNIGLMMYAAQAADAIAS